MGDQFYYVDKQLRKLEGKEKQELQKSNMSIVGLTNS